MKVPRGADPLLLTAMGSSVLLALTVAFVPDAPWRMPLGLAGGVWAPGYALVALAYPRRDGGPLVTLERHALAVAAGLVLTPVLALAASVAAGFTALSVSTLALLVTASLAAAAAARGHGAAPEPEARAPLPSPRATMAASLGALALAGALAVPAVLHAPSEPPALALVAPEGGRIDLDTDVNGSRTLVVRVVAGSSAAAGPLLVTWTRGDNESTVLYDSRVRLDAGEQRDIVVPLPTHAPGAHRLEARWSGPELAVHATFHVREAGT